MRAPDDNAANVAVTIEAAEELLCLREHYDKQLKFHLFLDENELLTLRIHDRLYEDDWVVEINGVGVSFSITLINQFQDLVLDCTQSEINKSGFEFRLLMGGVLVSRLGGDDVLNWIETEEVEVTDDEFGDFFYSVNE